MNATEIAKLSMIQLRAFCVSNAIEVTGDRRAKLTFINEIEMRNQLSVATDESTFTIGLSAKEPTYTIGLATPDSFDDSYEFVMSSETAFQSEVPDVLSVINKSNNMITLQQPIHQQAPNQKHSALIVVLIPLILLTVTVILIKIGIGALIPLIGSLIRFMGSIWQSVSDTDRGIESISITYSPAAAA